MATNKLKAVNAVVLQNDGHKRITEADDFRVVGGTAESHGAMTEKLLKMREKMKKKGRDFNSCSAKEFQELAATKTKTNMPKIQYEFITKMEAENYFLNHICRKAAVSLIAGAQYFVHDNCPGLTRKATKLKNGKWQNL